MTQEHVLNLIQALVVDHMTSVAKDRGWDRIVSQTNGKAKKDVEVALDRLCKTVRNQALEDAALCAEGYPKYGDATAEEIRNMKDKP